MQLFAILCTSYILLHFTRCLIVYIDHFVLRQLWCNWKKITGSPLLSCMRETLPSAMTVNLFCKVMRFVLPPLRLSQPPLRRHRREWPLLVHNNTRSSPAMGVLRLKVHRLSLLPSFVLGATPSVTISSIFHLVTPSVPPSSSLPQPRHRLRHRQELRPAYLVVNNTLFFKVTHLLWLNPNSKILLVQI